MKNNYFLLTVVFIMIVIFSNVIYSQEHLIILDEEFYDWQDISGISDSNDASSGNDLYTLKATNYGDYFFLLLEMNTEINLQDLNSITLYIDSDNDSSTGIAINGIGAELEYIFGTRSGTFYYDNTLTSIEHIDIGLVSSPTVSSNIFELQINRNSTISGHPLFPDSTVRIIVKNNIEDGDIIPNESGGYEYKFEQHLPQMSTEYSIKKLDENHLRVLTYNVEKDQLFEEANKEAHSRIFNAIDPDVIGFQEIYNHTAQETADLIEEFLPSSHGDTWYSSKSGSDIITISRFPITETFAIDANAAFLLDLNDKYEKDFLFVSAHTPCCDNNDTRQNEIDNFMAFIRDAKEEDGVLSLDAGTPIVIVGDMNLVGYKQQQTTLITGDIVNQDSYGNAFLPDWDSTYFADSKPNTTNMPSTFSWYKESSAFSPGRLDYVVYSNSVMSESNSFVLFTKALPEDSLRVHNLESSDVTSVSDHLPTVVDFEFPPLVSVKEDKSLMNYKFSLSQNYPNPFNPTTVIRYEIGETNFVTLKIYNSLGEEIKTLVSQKQSTGSYEVTFNTHNLTSGIYFYKLSTGGMVESKKMLLLK